MPEQAILHLVLGDSAGGNLRAAAASFGLQGSVRVFSDDLSHGPLSNTKDRAAYFKTLYETYEQKEDIRISPLEDFTNLSDQAEQAGIREICIWAGENASELTFLKMACHTLRPFQGLVTRVGATGLKSLPYIGPQTPNFLASLFNQREPVDPITRAALSSDFLRLADSDAPLRVWEAGEIVDVSEDYYDGLLLACCQKDWVSAARVVGSAMGRGDEHNLLGDVFLSGRIQHLITQGMIEASGPQTSLRDYVVRRK